LESIGTKIDPTFFAKGKSVFLNKIEKMLIDSFHDNSIEVPPQVVETFIQKFDEQVLKNFA